MGTPALSTASQLVRVSEVAKHLSLSRSAVYALMESGHLPYVRLGRKSRRVPMEAVERLIAQNMVPASE